MVGRDDLIAPPLVGTAFHRRLRRSGELRKRIRRPQHVRNISVLGFVAKPLTLHNEKPNTMVRRVCNHAAYPPFLFFVKVLRGTCHETGFRGCAAFLFRVKAAAPSRVGAGEGMLWLNNLRQAQ